MPDLPIAVCVLPEAPANQPRTVICPAYIHDLLAHAGLCYRTVDAAELAMALGDIALLVTIGHAELPPATRSVLSDWVTGGGAWLSVAAPAGWNHFLASRWRSR